MPTTDPTFYRTPRAAATAAPESIAYVAAFDPAGRVKDAIAVVDCDPGSSSYGGVVGWAELPTAGNELHHFGWSACSSALCHEGGATCSCRESGRRRRMCSISSPIPVTRC